MFTELLVVLPPVSTLVFQEQLVNEKNLLDNVKILTRSSLQVTGGKKTRNPSTIGENHRTNPPRIRRFLRLLVSLLHILSKGKNVEVFTHLDLPPHSLTQPARDRSVSAAHHL